MRQVSSLSCRLCLADNITAPFVDLKENVDRAEAVYHLLCLQFSLTNIDPGQPQVTNNQSEASIHGHVTNLHQ